MDASQTSLHLLQHFDSVAADTDPLAEDACRVRPTRGVAWVLQWAAALAVLLFSTTVLSEFAYCVMAEQLLARAARAGVLEATLPRATIRSIEQSVWRRLVGHATAHDDLKIALLQNGTLVGNKFEPRDGDRLTITLAMPAQAAMPSWLRKLTSWRGDATVVARAERNMPGQHLKAR